MMIRIVMTNLVNILMMTQMMTGMMMETTMNFLMFFEDYSHLAFDLPEISKLPKEDRFT